MLSGHAQESVFNPESQRRPTVGTGSDTRRQDSSKTLQLEIHDDHTNQSQSSPPIDSTTSSQVVSTPLTSVPEAQCSDLLQKLEHERNQYKAKAQAYKSNLRQSEANYRAASEQALASAAQLRTVESKLAQADAYAKEKKNEYQRLRKEVALSISSLQAEHSKVLEVKNAQLQQLQDKLMQGMVEGRWNPSPDNEIRHQIALLNSEMRNWSRDWAVKTLDPMALMKGDIVLYLAPFVRILDGIFPNAIIRPSTRMRDKLALTLLNAAIAHEVQVAFFDHPFFCTDPRDGSLWDTFRDMKKVDPKEAHRWRCTLWRLLNPPETLGMTQSAREVSEISTKRIKAYIESVNTRILGGPAQLLLRAPTSEPERYAQANGLRKILISAATIATSLWTQRSFIKTFDLGDMLNRKMDFDIACPYLQGHPLSRVDSDDDSHNGREILIVVRPALLAFEEDDTAGLEGDAYRVLAKAIVLLEDRV